MQFFRAQAKMSVVKIPQQEHHQLIDTISNKACANKKEELLEIIRTCSR